MIMHGGLPGSPAYGARGGSAPDERNPRKPPPTSALQRRPLLSPPDNPAGHMRRPTVSGSRLLTSAYRTREHRETAFRSFP